MAALAHSCASLITSFTPVRPRRARSRRKSLRKVPASEGLAAMPGTSLRQSAFTPTAMVTATDKMRPPSRNLRRVASIRKQGRSPPIGLVRKASTRSSTSSRSRPTRLLEMPVPPMACARSSMARVETPWTQVFWMTAVSAFSTARRGGIEEQQETGHRAELRDAQLDIPGARPPILVAAAVPLRQAFGGLLCVRGAGPSADPELHKALGLAQQIRIATLIQELFQVHYRLGHRDHPSVHVGFRNPTLTRNPMTASATSRPGT